jgi:hypothetical protein
MERWREPTEFGFTTSPYLPPDRPRPAWKTLLFGALLTLIPVVGPAVSAVYIDRRRVPATYDFGSAVATALIQFAAILLLALVVWAVFGLLFGVSVQLNPKWSGPGV